MRLFFRLANLAGALVTLASAVAVLGSDLFVPGYREHYRDAPWFVTAYAAFYLFVVIEFARGGRLLPWVALTRAVAAYAFVAAFVALWPEWRMWTPARYVYQVFDWGEGTHIGFFALIFLGRGAFNTLSAFYFTEPWWRPLRSRRPLFGRFVTTLPFAAIVFFVWGFFELVREERQTVSPQAQQVARMVLAGLDCAAVKAHQGETTTDLRQRGEERYHVEIAYDCRSTRVRVLAEDGRIGTVSEPRLECCDAGS